jgi:amino acid adenylation domain-containing protein
MDRSTEMIVGWLATLKAGAAFVPIDPAYPKERIAFQIQDCGARLLLVRQNTHASLPSLSTQVAVIELAAGGEGFDGEADSNPPCSTTPANLAYVIYTSGSTGQPKGVAVEHRALMNLVSWHQRAYSISSLDRATHLASPAFDASVWEIWPYLAAGASVHIPAEDVRVSPALLWRWISDARISIAFMPTPLAEAAMNETWPDALALRALLTGGDKLKRPAPKDFPCPLFNHYGPTENTVVTTATAVATDGSDATPTIGRPIANTQTYVLDQNRRMVPIGLAGELYIGGESLARGYVRRPELTAEKFVLEPYMRRTGARLYRSGDLVRWTERGELEFLGRLDGQVKIRGCRIEPGEIEAALQRHPAVRECVVQVRPNLRGEQQLIGYVLRRTGATRNGPADLIEFLRGQLPGFMVPAAIICLEAWPLTANGKIDRAALPAPESNQDDDEFAIAAPRTAVEQVVSEIWADVLGHATISRHDSFFDLGGHSLLAAQVVSRLNATSRGAISVRALFDHPTLAAFAAYAEPRLRNDSDQHGPVQRVKRRAMRPDLELATPN